MTIRKIAEIAQVSRGTVDKVLNNRKGVSAAVRKRILEITRSLDYKPNAIGKALNNQKKKILIGMIIPPESNPFFKDVRNGITAAQEEFKAFGIEVDCRAMKSIDPLEQLRLINALVDKGISALCLVAIDKQEIRDAVDKLTDNSIPVVTFNSDLEGSKRMCFIGQDHIKSGRTAGGLMGKLLHGKGTVAIVTGSHDILAHNQRITGFTNVIREDFPEIRIAETVENMDQDAVSFEVTSSVLEKHPDLNGLYLTAGGVSGAAKAILRARKDRALKVISFDRIPDTVRLVKEGVIDFTICQDPFFQGYQPVKILSDYFLYTRRPETDFIETGIDIRMKENIDYAAD